MRIIVLLALLLAGCATPEPERISLSAIVPPTLQVCPDGTPAPVPPPPPRSLKSLIDWALVMQSAQSRTERARSECAERLARLNRWIELVILKIGDTPP